MRAKTPYQMKRQPVPPPASHVFSREDDPPPLRLRLELLRRAEWKHTSVGDGRGAAEAAITRISLLDGWNAAKEYRE